jgi:hypothetical protein
MDQDSLLKALTGIQTSLEKLNKENAAIRQENAGLKESLSMLNARIDANSAQFGKRIPELTVDLASIDHLIAPVTATTPTRHKSGSTVESQKDAAADDKALSSSPTPGGRSSSVSGPSSIWAPKIVLVTYPKQVGVHPATMSWGNPDPMSRGPVVVSRHKGTVRRRNALGAHGGCYSIYHALAIASNSLAGDHKPVFTNCEPAEKIGPFPAWGDPKKIVGMDPWGHLAPWQFKSYIDDEGLDIRPTIAITKAHMRLPELENSVKAGRLVPDGKICINETGELAVTKVAVEPVWYLPGVAERFGIGKSRSLISKCFPNVGYR